MKENRFIIFSAGYNCAKYIKFHMESVSKQLYENYVHVVVDDCSTDNTYTEIQKYTTPKTMVHKTTENVTWMPNAVKYIDRYISSDEDIIVLLDLDDWLYNEMVFSKVDENYMRTGCWAAYSKHIRIRRMGVEGKVWGSAYKKNVLKERSFRKDKLRFMHLRTFKAFLWKNLNKDDLKDSEGNYAKCTYDYGVLFPILEMLPLGKLLFIREVLHIYNLENPMNDRKLRKPLQKNLGDWFRKKPVYPVLERQ